MKKLRQIGSIAFVLGLFTVIFVGLPWYVISSSDLVIPQWFRIAILCIIGGMLLVLMTVTLEQKSKKKKSDELLQTQPQKDIILMNSAEIPDREITEILGLTKGHTIYAIWIGNDLSALVRLILGGELNEYTDMMGHAREIATNRMIAQAEKLDADAIINIRYMTTSVIGSAAELLAYGTAVKLKDMKNTE